MDELSKIKQGDILRLKKAHPCGSYDWQVLRCGMDFGLRCLGCGRVVALSRQEMAKRLKEIRNLS